MGLLRKSSTHKEFVILNKNDEDYYIRDPYGMKEARVTLVLKNSCDKNFKKEILRAFDSGDIDLELIFTGKEYVMLKLMREE